jgi:hypothetical protein
MAIITQYPYIDETGAEHDNLVKTYSDAGKTILQVETNCEYDEAIDIYPSKYTYQETEHDVQEDEDVDYETAYKTLAKEVMSNG